MKKDIQTVYGILFGAIVASVFLTILIVAAEFSSALMLWLKNSFGHHWLGKSVLGIGAFIFFSAAGFLAAPVSREEALSHIERMLFVLCWSVCIGTLVFLALYLYQTINV